MNGMVCWLLSGMYMIDWVEWGGATFNFIFSLATAIIIDRASVTSVLLDAVSMCDVAEYSFYILQNATFH